MRGPRVHQALDVQDLINAGIDHLVRRRGVKNIDGATPDNKESLLVDLGMSGEIVADLKADVVNVHGKRVRWPEGEHSGASRGGGKGVRVVSSAMERVLDLRF